GTFERRVSERCEVPFVHAARRRIVVCQQPLTKVPALLRERFSLRARPMDLPDGYRLGGHGAGARRAVNRAVAADAAATRVAAPTSSTGIPARPTNRADTRGCRDRAGNWCGRPRRSLRLSLWRSTACTIAALPRSTRRRPRGPLRASLASVCAG